MGQDFEPLILNSRLDLEFCGLGFLIVWVKGVRLGLGGEKPSHHLVITQRSLRCPNLVSVFGIEGLGAQFWGAHLNLYSSEQLFEAGQSVVSIL